MPEPFRKWSTQQVCAAKLLWSPWVVHLFVCGRLWSFLFFLWSPLLVFVFVCGRSLNFCTKLFCRTDYSPVRQNNFVQKIREPRKTQKRKQTKRPTHPKDFKQRSCVKCDLFCFLGRGGHYAFGVRRPHTKSAPT